MIASNSLTERPNQTSFIFPAVFLSSVLLLLIVWLSEFVDHDVSAILELAVINEQGGLLKYLQLWQTNVSIDEGSGRWMGTTLRYLYYSQLVTFPTWVLPAIILSAITLGSVTVARTLYGCGKEPLAMGLIGTSIFLLVTGTPGDLIFCAVTAADYPAGYLTLGLLFICTAKIIEKRNQNSSVYVVLACIFSAISCGFSETLMIVPPILMFGLMILSSAHIKQWVIISIGTLVGAVVHLLSPAQLGRRAEIGTDIDIMSLISGTIFYGARTIAPIMLVLALITLHPLIRSWVIFLGNQATARLKYSGALMIVSGVLMYPFMIEGMLFWAVGDPGPGRARSYAILLLISTWPITYRVLCNLFADRKISLPRSIRLVICTIGFVSLLLINLPSYIGHIVQGQMSPLTQSINQSFIIEHQNESKTDVTFLEKSKPVLTVPFSKLESYRAENWNTICASTGFGNCKMSINQGHISHSIKLFFKLAISVTVTLIIQMQEYMNKVFL